MRYKYVVVYQLTGIICPEGNLAGQFIDISTLQARANLTRDLESLPIDVDKACAVGRNLLGGLFGQSGEGTFEERIAKEVCAIRERRANDSSNDAFMIVEADGSIDEINIEHQRELDGFIFAICDSPIAEIVARYKSALEGLLAALALSSENLCSVKKIVNQVIYYRRDDKPIFCYSLTASGSMYASSPLKDEAIEKLPRHARRLAKHQALVDVARLLTKSLAVDDDPLLSFLSVWSGLEIFVNKNFKEYENKVLSRLAFGNPPPIPSRVVERIRNVMSDKYRISDKFSVIASELAETEAESDQPVFETIKVARDRLLHGEEVPFDALPIGEAKRLLRKYLRLHLDRDEA